MFNNIKNKYISRGKMFLAVFLVALAVIPVYGAAAGTLSDNYDQLKNSYRQFFDRLTGTGKVTDTQLRNWVGDLDGYLSGETVSDSNFDSVMRRAMAATLLAPENQAVLDAAREVYSQEIQQTIAGNIPQEFRGFYDTVKSLIIKRESSGSGSSSGGGSSGASSGSGSSTGTSSGGDSASSSTTGSTSSTSSAGSSGNSGSSGATGTPGSAPDAAASSAPMFKDIAGHWAAGDIESMASRQVVKGDPDGRFRPDDTVTRAEFTAMLVRLLAINGGEGGNRVFDDVGADKWYYSAVNAAVAAGIVQGYSQETFEPECPVTREQLAAMAVRGYVRGGGRLLDGPAAEAVLAPFKDQGETSGWASVFLATAVDKKIVTGYPGGLLKPGAQATRAEALVILKRLAAVAAVQ
ncbi:S-layer homology domain-containing protein [Pelotomaculum isophthalicicum JI]|uniref:S-layer homology domain-containing protein n=1 Tax=Pelotomaculum isophthalicicum JI TaxID=947010 RepID=A0A9X4JV31_9FIRM|nr:S-layer homology domain-containing protein [Pelotomaculum isophthalicicum]MDF9406778.1 S-layer homology domain-containing protein [Pelotomaculum isophthalicicum JI]